jgi:arylsulfatase A-like enzyme
MPKPFGVMPRLDCRSATGQPGRPCFRSYCGRWDIAPTIRESGISTKRLQPRSFSGFKNSKEVFGNDGQFSGITTIDGDDAGYQKPDSGYYSTVAIVDHAIEQLQDHAKNYKEQPFFQFVAFISPHFPLQALPQDIARYKNRYLTGWDAMREERWQRVQKLGIVHSDFSSMERNIGPPYPLPDDIKKLGPDEINLPVPWSSLNPGQKKFQATKMAIHAAMVDEIDQEVGRLVEQLKRMGVYDNTAILFLSDNGASAEMMVRGLGHDPAAAPGSAHTYLSLGPGWSSASNTPFRRHKVWVHEGGISTPLIVHWPNVIHAKGELRRDPAHLIDIVPTLMEIAGGKVPTEWNGLPVPPPPGKSLVPEFTRNGAVSHDSLWWMHEGNRALRMGNWKIVSAGDRSSWDIKRMTSEPAYFDAKMTEAFKAPWELYDLSKDRAELHDLAAEYPERVQEMAQIWSQVYAKNLQLAGGAHPTRAANRSESESFAKD